MKLWNINFPSTSNVFNASEIVMLMKMLLKCSVISGQFTQIYVPLSVNLLSTFALYLYKRCCHHGKLTIFLALKGKAFELKNNNQTKPNQTKTNQNKPNKNKPKQNKKTKQASRHTIKPWVFFYLFSNQM